MFSIPWYIFLLQFVAGAFLANGVPHFVQGISGARFHTPFASPPGVGESSPVVNVLWGFLNLVIGFALLFEFAPKGADVVLEWVFVGLGALMMALFCAWHFRRVRARTQAGLVSCPRKRASSTAGSGSGFPLARE